MKSFGMTDIGRKRKVNQDYLFFSDEPVGCFPNLYIVADGMGGHKAGDKASSYAVNRFVELARKETKELPFLVMERLLNEVNEEVYTLSCKEEQYSGMGTTFVAATVVDGIAYIMNIGDSRLYYFDEKIHQVTMDHSLVEELVRAGELDRAESRNHPQKNIITKAVGVAEDVQPDFFIVDMKENSRILLCSDGLCGVLEDSTLQEVLSACSDQEECAQQLVSMALRAGSTDNVTAVIADATLALDADAFDLPHQTPLVGGAASASLEPIADIINEPVASAPALREGKKSPAARAAALRNGKNPNEDDNPPEQRVAQPSTVREENGDRTNPDTGEIPVVQKDDGRISADPNDPEVAKAIRNEHIEQRKTKRTRTRRNRVIAIIVTIVVLLGLAGGAFATYRWSQTKYYIGDDNGEVAIFQGVPTSLFGFQLSHAVTDTHMKTSELPPSWQEQLAQGISFDTYGEAKTHTRLIKKQLKQQQDEAAQKEQDKANGESDNKSSGTTSDKSSGKSDKSDDASANKSGGDQS